MFYNVCTMKRIQGTEICPLDEDEHFEVDLIGGEEVEEVQRETKP